MSGCLTPEHFDSTLSVLALAVFLGSIVGAGLTTFIVYMCCLRLEQRQ